MSPSIDNLLDANIDHNFCGVRVIGRPTDSLWDMRYSKGRLIKISPYKSSEEATSDNRLLGPSLCHPHIHLDKCFLLSHPKYADLEIQKGDFAEAMKLTSEAKSRFSHEDLRERGRALIEESISFGVTHMRAFVEVDAGVGMKCIEAGLSLKKEFIKECHIQICVFAQDPLFSYDDNGIDMRKLFKEAASRDGVDAIGSTPYVEKSLEHQKQNIVWMVELAKQRNLLLDFHLDYNLDANSEPMVYSVISALNTHSWQDRTVTLGHCTRLTLFTAEEWMKLREKIGTLPIHFVGLPTSDLFMMGRPADGEGGGLRNRGTMQIPQMIEKYGINGAIGINNVGNAFTPQGSCDPMALVSMAVGVYQAGRKPDADILLQCISTRARAAIGIGINISLEVEEGDAASVVLFGPKDSQSFRTRKTVQDLVYDAGRERTVLYSHAC